jgi:hypothetical protein
MATRGPLPFVLSATEQRVFEHHARALARGEPDSVHAATLACLVELRRLRGAGTAGIPASPLPKYGTLYKRLWQRVRASRLHAPQSRWLPIEERVVARYVRAFVDGRCPTAIDAAQACAQEFERLRRQRPGAGWSAVPRSDRALAVKVLKLARAEGRVPPGQRWTTAEKALLDWYARALARRRYLELREAATDCHRELAQLRRRSAVPARGPARRYTAILDRLLRRARALGWSQNAVRWLPSEQRIVDASVRKLLTDHDLTANRAARECHLRLRRLARRTARLSVPSHRRTYSTILTYLLRRLHAVGRTRSTHWLPEENRIVERFALHLVQGKYRDTQAALPACCRALSRCRGRLRQVRGREFVLQRRTRAGVLDRLFRASRRLNQPRPGTKWTPAEEAACGSWLRWYDRHRSPRPGALRQAAAGLMEELQEMSSRRTIGACAHRLLNAWMRQQGLA